MTNKDKPEEDGVTVQPRGSMDATMAPTPPHNPSPDPETIDPATVEAVSLEEAGLRGGGTRPEGLGSHAAAVALIVLLTLIAAGAGAALGPYVRGGDSAVAALESRVTTLEDSGSANDLVARLDTLAGQATGLESRIAALEARPSADTAATGDAALTDKVAALEQATAALAGRVDGALDARLAALSGRLDALEAGGTTVIASDGTAPSAAAIADLRQQVAALAAEIGAAPQASDLATVETRLTTLNSDQSALTTQLATIDSRLGDLAATAAAVDALKTQVETLANRSGDPRAAFALAAGQLREQVLAGESYAEALATATSLAPDDAAVAAGLGTLATWQADGVATRERLADSLDATSFAVVEAARSEAAETWIDKTVAELASIVTVRRVDGEDGATDADSVTARAEARLAQGDLDGAITAMEGLSGNAAAVAADWLAMAKARQGAEQAIDALSARAIALIGGAG